MPFLDIKNKLKDNLCLSPKFGIVTKITPTLVYGQNLAPRLGDIITVNSENTREIFGMVIFIDREEFAFMPFGSCEGLKNGDRIIIQKDGLTFPGGIQLLGRVLNPLGQPIDNLGGMDMNEKISILSTPIKPMDRGMIEEIFPVGVKAIDGMLTCGRGQKIGIFAGSGVGKSTLMGMIVRGCKADIKVIALIGERGREVLEFIQKNLNNELKNTVIIVATSDDSALMRKYGAFCAMAVAEYFKNLGHDVLFVMDSITRFAMAQREIGLALGEPPTTKGYPPSVLSLLPQLMERVGVDAKKGSITAFFTVLVEGDDMTDPIADQSRSILDGHILLDRELSDFGIYPPIQILSSISRLSQAITTKEHQKASRKFRELYALLKENEILIRIGSYQKGNDARLDEAIEKQEFMKEFLAQDQNQVSDFDQTLRELQKIHFPN